MSLLEVKSVSKTYGKGNNVVHALKDINFSVDKGEYIAIVGESGSGKSTLLNIIGALDTPTDGKVIINNKELFSMKDSELTVFRRRNIGFIFQGFNLIPELTVEENIIFPVLLDYKKLDRKYLEELLNILGLQERKNHLPSELSGGQQQRVAIGRALITRPSLILADEPTGNLDSKNSSEVISLLKESSQKYEQTIIMITHSRSLSQKSLVFSSPETCRCFFSLFARYVKWSSTSLIIAYTFSFNFSRTITSASNLANFKRFCINVFIRLSSWSDASHKSLMG